ncbi:hypothetical protein K3181_09640 [Qipengyuania sp. YG27]|uniref:Uncharacterized protein n=1 Tax=Qipengyuania mesophila TaxID=2867246 RepID=A0ABS7JVT2_9SPHN|nr:hypothetical protein [Qipengyuania mesophila]MBX7501704.1 hypothetical protein [Qipengyuania mesophila]
MFDIWESLVALRQPCLMRAPSDAAIGGDRVVSSSMFRSVDELLWEDIERATLESGLPPIRAEVLYTGDKWLTTSALQKCIRRGHVDLAERYARSGVQIDADHTFRRLAIIALEDVGLGDLKLIAATLAVLGDKRRRQRLGEERLAVYLATQMSGAVKSRLACEMLSLVEYDPNSKTLAKPLYDLDEESLCGIVRTNEFGSSKQLISLWLLHGTGRLRSRKLRAIAGAGQGGLLRLLTMQGAPLIFHYIVRMGLSRCRDSLAIPYVLLGRYADANPLSPTIAERIPKPEMIGPYPSFAYDMHTRSGRFALQQAEASWKAQLSAAGIRSCGNLIFALEGGCLDRRLSGACSEAIREKAIGLEIFGREVSIADHCLANVVQISNINKFRRRAAVSA